MPETYQPRKLPRNREYPGYQFYCTIQKKNDTAESCFCFAVLCVIDWLKERLRETDIIPREINRLPERQRSHVIGPSDLESFTISSGFSAYVVSLPDHGIWTLRLKESDSDTGQRKAVSGRYFTTNVGIRILNEREVELGIRIDVTDPEEAQEIDFAFRPKLLRYLHEAPGLTLAQVSALPYQQALPVETEEQFKTLRGILDSSEGTMPLILVTQGIRLPKEETASLFGSMPFPSSLAAPPPGLFQQPFPARPVIEYYYPFDADDIASHNFGYAITCRISEKMHDALKSRLKKDYTPGDILFAEPKRFGGAVRIISKDDPDPVKQAWTRAHCYSKDRKYSFGDVQFEYDARNIENREKIEEIRASSDMAAEEKLTRLNQTIDELQTENEKRVRKITELRTQAQQEYDKGVEAERQRNLDTIQENEQLERDLQAARARIQQLEQENSVARAQRSALEAIRSLAEMPQSTADVVNYYQKVYGDHIVFTERGIKTAARCDIKPEGLWYYLYHMATSLYELHHDNVPDIVNAFQHATGIEVAMGEGKLSHRDNKIMNQRDDIYEGKELSMEPHVKLLPQKAGAEHQRIYYCYDHELDRIIIGRVGEHLKTAGTNRMG